MIYSDKVCGCNNGSNNGGLNGLGDAQTLHLTTGIVSTGIETTASTLVAAGAIGGPIGLAIGAVAAVGAMVANWLFAPDTKKIAATQIVNQVEPYLKQNLTAYINGGHTKAEQTQALSTFDQLWNLVLQKCGDPQLGQAGVNCIQDRDTDVKGYNWFKLYRDPIANDPNVKIPESISNTLVSRSGSGIMDVVSNLSSGVSGNGFLLLGLLGLGIVLLSGGNNK